MICEREIELCMFGVNAPRRLTLKGDRGEVVKAKWSKFFHYLISHTVIMRLAREKIK